MGGRITARVSYPSYFYAWKLTELFNSGNDPCIRILLDRGHCYAGILKIQRSSSRSSLPLYITNPSSHLARAERNSSGKNQQQPSAVKTCAGKKKRHKRLRRGWTRKRLWIRLKRRPWIRLRLCLGLDSCLVFLPYSNTLYTPK